MPGPVGHAGVVAAVERLDQVLCVRGVFWRSGGVIDGDDGVVFAGLDGAGYGTGLRSTFSETRVRGMALTLRYPYPSPEAANAPAARRDAGQACHRAERTRRPQPVDQQGLLPARQAPQAGARAEQFGGPLPPHAARQRTYDILSPSLQENVRTLLSGWASMAETKGRECG